CSFSSAAFTFAVWKIRLRMSSESASPGVRYSEPLGYRAASTGVRSTSPLGFGNLMTPIVSARNLGKCYRVQSAQGPRSQYGYRTLRDDIMSALTWPLRMFNSGPVL